MSESPTAPEAALQERIVDLEVRIAYQERLISDLDSVVREFCKRTELLQQELLDMKKSLESQPIGPADEVPPHY
jgi:SlyX protein